VLKTHAPSILPSLLASIATSFIALTAWAGDALSIRDIAPEGAVLVAGVDDLKATLARLEGTSFGKIWNDQAVAEQMKGIRDEMQKSFEAAAEGANAKFDEIGWPASAGGALLVDLDEELGLPSIEYVFFLDWAGAEAANGMLESFVTKAEADAKADGRTVRTEEIRGRRVLVAKVGGEVEGGEGGMDEEGEDGMDEEFGMGMGMPDLGPSEVCLVADKGRLLAASSVPMMDMLLGRVDGDRAKAVGESEDFRAAAELAGGTQDFYAVLSTKAAQPLLQTMPQFMLFEPLLKRVVGDIGAWSFGLHAKDGVLEVGQGIYMPSGKAGLLSLVEDSSEPKAPPAIVPSDALSYGRMNVRFDKIVAVLDEAISGMPEDQAEMIKGSLDMYRPAMTAAFAAMGPEMHLWGTEPNAEDPMASTTVTAIAMKNDKESERAVSDFINLLPLGLQSRDFNGMTILSDEFAPFSVGIGGGYVLIGSTTHVEQALRAVDAKGEAGLASDADFAKSFSSISKDPCVAMAWFDVVRQVESTERIMKAIEAQVGELAGPIGGADGAEIPVVGVGTDDLAELPELLKPELVKKYVQDALIDFRSTPKGFSTRFMVRPTAQ
jgi:hypothetical protein